MLFKESQERRGRGLQKDEVKICEKKRDDAEAEVFHVTVSWLFRPILGKRGRRTWDRSTIAPMTAQPFLQRLSSSDSILKGLRELLQLELEQQKGRHDVTSN